MTTILPNQIPEIQVPFMDKAGRVSQQWWLFFYNISLQVLGNQGSSAAAYAAVLQADVDADTADVDALALSTRVAGLEKMQIDLPTDPVVSQLLALVVAELPDSPKNTGAAGTGANPTGVVGLTAVNGTATTFTRSDGAPALNQAIAPTWTGAHTFNAGATVTKSSGTALSVTGAVGAQAISLTDANYYTLQVGRIPGASGPLIMGTALSALALGANNVQSVLISTSGNVSIAAPTSGDTLTVAPSATSGALIASSAALTNNAGTTSPTLGATGPTGATTPTKWLKINDNGTIRSVPSW